MNWFNIPFVGAVCHLPDNCENEAGLRKIIHYLYFLSCLIAICILVLGSRANRNKLLLLNILFCCNVERTIKFPECLRLIHGMAPAVRVKWSKEQGLAIQYSTKTVFNSILQKIINYFPQNKHSHEFIFLSSHFCISLVCMNNYLFKLQNRSMLQFKTKVHNRQLHCNRLIRLWIMRMFYRFNKFKKRVYTSLCASRLKSALNLFCTISSHISNCLHDIRLQCTKHLLKDVLV